MDNLNQYTFPFANLSNDDVILLVNNNVQYNFLLHVIDNMKCNPVSFCDDNLLNSIPFQRN